MSILEAYKASNVIAYDRCTATDYAALSNKLFYIDKLMMVCGDAKKIVEDIFKAIE